MICKLQPNIVMMIILVKRKIRLKIFKVYKKIHHYIEELENWIFLSEETITMVVKIKILLLNFV